MAGGREGEPPPIHGNHRLQPGITNQNTNPPKPSLAISRPSTTSNTSNPPPPAAVEGETPALANPSIREAAQEAAAINPNLSNPNPRPETLASEVAANPCAPETPTLDVNQQVTTVLQPLTTAQLISQVAKTLPSTSKQPIRTNTTPIETPRQPATHHTPRLKPGNQQQTLTLEGMNQSHHANIAKPLPLKPKDTLAASAPNLDSTMFPPLPSRNPAAHDPEPCSKPMSYSTAAKMNTDLQDELYDEPHQDMQSYQFKPVTMIDGKPGVVFKRAETSI